MRYGPLVTSLALLAVLAAGCSGSDGRDGAPASTAEPVACEAEEQVPELSGGHLIGDTEPPRPYNSVPPTSGWHSAGAPKYGVHGAEDPLTEPEQITVLELDGVVLSYAALSGPERIALEAVGREHERVAVTPYDQLDAGEVAMSAWGVLRRCDGVDSRVIEDFIAAHEGGGPDH